MATLYKDPHPACIFCCGKSCERCALLSCQQGSITQQESYLSHYVLCQVLAQYPFWTLIHMSIPRFPTLAPFIMAIGLAISTVPAVPIIPSSFVVAVPHALAVSAGSTGMADCAGSLSSFVFAEPAMSVPQLMIPNEMYWSL